MSSLQICKFIQYTAVTIMETLLAEDRKREAASWLLAITLSSNTQVSTLLAFGRMLQLPPLVERCSLISQRPGTNRGCCDYSRHSITRIALKVSETSQVSNSNQGLCVV